MSHPLTHHMPVFVFFEQLFFEIIFNDIQWKSRKKFSIWQLFQTIPVTRDTGELFYMAIPGRHIFFTDRPVYCKAISCRTFIIEIAPALRGLSPHQRFTTHLVTANPIERLFLHIRM